MSTVPLKQLPLKLTALAPKVGRSFTATERVFVVRLHRGVRAFLTLQEDEGRIERIGLDFCTACCGSKVALNFGRTVCGGCRKHIEVPHNEASLTLRRGMGVYGYALDEDTGSQLLESWIATADPLGAIVEAPIVWDNLQAVLSETGTLVRMSEGARKP